MRSRQSKDRSQRWDKYCLLNGNPLVNSLSPLIKEVANTPLNYTSPTQIPIDLVSNITEDIRLAWPPSIKKNRLEQA